ncbi:hypothetical protein GcC1_051022 [Golovinomyces cichoracearum]|uniref:DUF3824 domain-containing protein n=1 Tax=Golovinomyces cichoracearum TaxID=62708 RepID=A0A420IWR8_9PEZI|nr:hypothetical protein GcC1_051022 [Golovinomyces cichoracearum]
MNEYSPHKSNVSTIHGSNDYSSHSEKIDHPSTHHTIKRYHVFNGEINEEQNTSQHSRLTNTLYFEQKESKHPSKNLKIGTVHHPIITHDLYESQIKNNQACSKSTVRDTCHEFETCKNLEELQMRRDESEKESNTEKRKKEGHSKKVNLKPSRLDNSQELGQYKSQPGIKFLVSESEVPQSFTSSSQGYRAGERQETNRSGRKYENKPEQEHPRKEFEKIKSSNGTRDLIGGIIAGAGVSAMLVNHHEKVGKGPQDPTKKKKILGGAALGVVGAEVLNRARNQYHHTDGGGLKSTDKQSHKKIKSALGLAAASLAVAAVANQYSHAHKVKNDDIKEGHGSAPNKSKAPKSRDTKKNPCPLSSVDECIQEDSKNPSILIPNGEPSLDIDCRATENRRSRSRSRSRSRLQNMPDSETIGTRLAGVAADILERCKKSEETGRENICFGRESCRHSRHRRRSSVRAQDKNSFSDLSPYSESELIEYGSDPIYLTDTPLSHTKKKDSASMSDAYSNLKSRDYNHQRGGSCSESQSLNRTKLRSRKEFIVDSDRNIS